MISSLSNFMGFSIPNSHASIEGSTINDKISRFVSARISDCSLTPGNQERVAYIVGAAIAVKMALVSHSSSEVIVSIAARILSSVVVRILPTSLMALAGYAIWQAYQTPDYDNPREMALYRKEAEILPLVEIFKKHTFNVRFKEVLTQEQVTKKFTEETAKIDNVKDLEEYRSNLSWRVQGFEIPSVKEINQERLKKEAISLSYDEIIKRHEGLVNVLEWGLLTQEHVNNNSDRYLTDLKSLTILHPRIYPEVNKALIKAGLRVSE